MHAAAEESLTLASGPAAAEISGGSFSNSNQTESERLNFQVELLKLKDTNENDEAVSWRRRRSCRRRIKFGTAVTPVVDMTISGSCRCGVSVPVMFWTTVCLVLLAGGVNSVSDERTRFSRSKYEQDADVQMQETLNVMQFLRELLQRQQQRANQGSVQVYNNGEDLSEREIDWRKLPLPLLYQIRSIINDGSKEEDKRGSYMSLCHFKICNLG